ncbi:MAG TPA: hypothetical protein VNU01_11675, partial [Egibacteraceae bacterium]|nr:hypothetical protein [Egibacteraceae bacterium]
VEPDATAPAAGEQDGSAGSVGSEVAVEDPTALTGGWEGGTPNTGTAISAGGLLLLAVGAGLLWLRRART